ncbi:MAG: DegV family protein [Lachnospiraceae bacterium]|nr:DegV family protein [Lachnospiraceae bacterium]
MIQIITDSTCDLSPEQVQKLGVHVIPLSVNFGEEAYTDGVTIDKQTFYTKLSEAEKLPTTSQPNPADMLDHMAPLLEQGDEIVGIFLSSKLSGTFQSATIAADMADSDRIHLVDSLNATFGLGLLVQIAARYRDEGKTAAEIVEILEEVKSRLRVIAFVDTLKYLQMGGRISAATAVVGSLLGINPLVSIIDGAVESIGKARGRKAAYRHLKTLFEQEAMDESYPIFFGASNAPEAMAELEAVITPCISQPVEILHAEIGSSIGTHVGPGAAGVAYIAK